jgi:hypothetical protein
MFQVVRESELILKAIEKQGLQGVEGDKNRVVRHWKMPHSIAFSPTTSL